MNTKVASFKRGKRHQRHFGRQMSRMYPCWCFLAFLPFVLGETGQMSVSYNRREKTLRMECPGLADPNLLLQSTLSRICLSNTSQMAKWRPNEDSSFQSTSDHDRVTVDNSYKERLVAELSDVTCHDSATYECKNYLSGRHVTYRHTFQYREDAGTPYISKDPLKAYYEEGEVLKLSCNASIGDRDNGIVWEIKRPEGFVHLSNPRAKVFKADIGDKNCRLMSHGVLEYTLAAEDDGAVFQCRLNKTGHTSQTAVAMRCRDVSTPEDPRPVTPAASQKDRGGQSGSGDSSTVGIVVGVGAGVVVLVVVGAVMMMRRWRQKQMMRPIVVMDTPDSSEYGGGYAERQLPNLPSGQRQHRNHHNHNHTNRMDRQHPHLPLSSLTHPTTTSSSTTHSHGVSASRYVDGPQLTCSTLAQPLTPEDPNKSIYVSMTGLDTLGLGTCSKEGGVTQGVRGESGGGQQRSFAEGSMTSGLSDSFGSVSRDAEDDCHYHNHNNHHNASIYHNQNASSQSGGSSESGVGSTRNHHNKGNTSNNNNSNGNAFVDDDVTRLKIVD